MSTYMNRPQAFESSSTLASFQSQTSSTDFTSTASSLSVRPGPGVLSGKAIFALGKAVIRGAENLVIRQRLLFVSSKFPHSNAEHFEGINTVYKDLLELSRVNLYPDSVRLRAIKALLVQIGSQQTYHLLTALRNWPSVEIQLFLSSLVSILDPIRLCSETGITGSDSGIIEAYRTSVQPWESHTLVPLVEFLCEVAGLRDSAARAVIQGGALDFLIHAYVTGFREPLRADRFGIDPMLLCTSGHHLLSSLSAKPSELELIYRHPLSSLWPTRDYIPFTTIDSRTKDRLHRWLSYEDDIAYWRLLSTFDTMQSRTINCDNDFYDMFVDFMELAGSNVADLRLSMKALRNLHWMSWQYKLHFRDCLLQHFSSRTVSHCVDILSRIILRIDRVLSLASPETELYLLPSDSISQPLGFSIVMALVRCAEAHKPLLTALLASNITSLLRHILQLDGDGRLLTQDVHSNDTGVFSILPALDQHTHPGADKSIKHRKIASFLQRYDQTLGNRVDGLSSQIPTVP